MNQVNQVKHLHKSSFFYLWTLKNKFDSNDLIMLMINVVVLFNRFSYLNHFNHLNSFSLHMFKMKPILF